MSKHSYFNCCWCGKKFPTAQGAKTHEAAKHAKNIIFSANDWQRIKMAKFHAEKTGESNRKTLRSIGWKPTP